MSDSEIVEPGCGCRFYTIGDSFVIEPCSYGCKWYLYAIGECNKLGHPRVIVEVP